MADSSGEKKRGLGDLVEGINHLIDLVDKLQQRGDEGINTSGDLKSGSGNVVGKYGVSIKTASPGGGSADDIDRYKVKKPGEEEPAVKSTTGKERIPFVDVIDQTDRVIIVAEMPGTSSEAVELNLDGASLDLYAASNDRVYRKSVALPYAVEPKPVATSYINGIYSAVFKRQLEQ